MIQTIYNERIEYVDIAKAVAIFLVVLGHTVTSNSDAKIIIYSFHMPLFFILAGFFLNDNNFNYSGIAVFINTKIKRLLVPYLIWGVIWMRLGVKNFALLLYGSYSSIIEAGSLSSLWFIPVLFTASVIAYLANSLINSLLSNKYRLLGKTIIASLFFLLSFLIDAPRIGLPFGADIAIMASSFTLWGGGNL